MMLESDLKILQAQDEQTLIEWWCQLNGWKWPEKLPDPEKEYGIDKKTYGNDSRPWKIMVWIMDQVGRKKILRFWNKNLTDEEFEDFWKGHHEGDKEAYERDRQSVLKKIREGKKIR